MMDRMQEFESLFNQPVPPALERSVQRARAKHRAARRGKLFGVPLASLAGAAAAFALLVNLSAPFALAASRVPFLKGLTAAVALSPSLRAAVEHDYVQYVGRSQTVNGITMTVEYLIVDQKQVNIFYTLESDLYPRLDGNVDLTLPDGTRPQAMVGWGHSEGDGPLRKITLDFTDHSVSDALILTCSAWPVGGSANTPPDAPTTPTPGEKSRPSPSAVADFSFTLRLDPGFTAAGEVYELNQIVTLDGQRITVDSVEVYPTHIRLNLRDDAANTAWLKGLDFYLEDEKGNRYEKISNGVTATGDPDTPFMASHRLESSYFGDAKHLTVHITGAEWLDKGKEYIDLDIANGTAKNLPQGVTLGKAQRRGDSVDVVLVAQDRGKGSYSILYNGWMDGDGERHHVDRMSFGSSYEEPGAYYDVPIPAGSFYEAFTLVDCPWDRVKLGVGFSRVSAFASPVELPIK